MHWRSRSKAPHEAEVQVIEKPSQNYSEDSERGPAKEHGLPSRVIDTSIMAKFGVFCAGCALMCDGYFNSLMSPMNLVFTQEYPKVYNSTMSTRVSNSLLVGEVIGMLTVGLTCDFIGRKSAMIFTTFCMVIGGILATAAHGTTTEGMFWMIIVMRGVIGFGSGGEYPTCSATAAESANESMKNRGRAFILATNLPLALGTPFCFIVFLIVWEAASGPKNLSTIWRVCFGIGCIWPMFIFWFRWKTANSHIYSKRKFMNWNVPWHRVFMFYWKRLIGTCGAWFIYDWVSFSGSSFSSLVIKSIVYDGDTKRTAEWQLLLGVIAIPGVFVGAYLCDIIGRKYTLIVGFSGYLVFGLVVGCAFDQIKEIIPLFVVFYGIFNSFGNLGPGDMMGLLSTELYATPVRGTLYGLSAALGKTGGAIGTQVFRPVQNNLGTRWIFIISAIIGVVGILITMIFIPNLDEDDLNNEDERFIAYLRLHGYTGTFGVEEPQSSTPEKEVLELEKEEKQQSQILVSPIS